MTYIAKPKLHHPTLATNKVGYTRRDYEGPVSTLCAGCGHDSISAAIVSACFESFDTFMNSAASSQYQDWHRAALAYSAGNLDAVVTRQSEIKHHCLTHSAFQFREYLRARDRRAHMISG